MLWLAFSFLVATILAGRGYARKSLSISGAVAALAVGSIHMACGLEFGLTLIVFYLTGSRLTRVGSEAKAKMEEKYREGGQRNAVQVLANSLAGAALAAAAAALPEHAAARGALRGAFMGHYACCCADTWSSELGVLSARPPLLLTAPWRRVPRGTNGGVSGLGLKAGAAGGALMGATFFLAGGGLGGAQGLKPYCRGAALAGPGGSGGRLLGLAGAAGAGAALGTLGTLLDSLLGATLQYSGVHGASGRVVGAPGPGVARVAGRHLLSNDAVNALAAALTAAAGGGAALLLQRAC